MLNRLGRDIAVYGGADLIFKLLQFALLPLYSHALSVAEFGILALVTVSATLAGVVVNLGVSYSVQRFYFAKELSEERRPILVSTGLVQLCLSGLAILAIAGVALHAGRDAIFERYDVPWVFILVGLLTVLPDQVAQYSLDMSRLQFAPWRFCAIAMMKNVVGLLIGLWLLFGRDLGVLGLLIGNLAAALLAAPLGLWLIRRDLMLRIDWAYLRMMLWFGGPFVFTAAAYWVFASIDRWLLAEMSDSVQVGLFSIAFKFASVLTLVIAAFHQAWIPIALRMAHEDTSYRQSYSMILDGWFFLLAWLALGLALFSRDLMTLMTPEAYWPAATALAFGGAAIALSGTTQVTSLGLTIEKRTVRIAAGAWIGAAVNIVLNLLLIPPFGANGSAMATVVTYAFLTCFYLWSSQRFHPIPLHPGRLGYSLLLVGGALTAPLLPHQALLDPVWVAAKLAILGLALWGGMRMKLLPPVVMQRFGKVVRMLVR